MVERVPDAGGAPAPVTPWMDPVLARIRAEAAGGPPEPLIDQVPIEVARRYQLESKARWNVALPGRPEPERFTLAGREAVAYGSGPGTILYFHGGGWATGGFETHHAIMEALADETGWRVVGIRYRLAPDHPFPAGLDDCIAAVKALDSAGPVALAGDSAGANLALGAGIACRGRPNLAALLLFYGCYEPACDKPSHALFGDGRFGLSTTRMRWFWNAYLGNTTAAEWANRAASFDDLAGLPPTYVCAAGLDTLRDESRALADRMLAEGVSAALSEVPGVTHGFLHFVRALPVARRVLAETAAMLGGVRAAG